MAYDLDFFSPPSKEECEMARLLDLIDAEWRSDPARPRARQPRDRCHPCRRAQDGRVMIDPSYQDYCNANYSEADIPRLEACPICNGRGLISHPDSHEHEDCEACAGSGAVESTFLPATSSERPRRAIWRRA